MAPCVNWPFYRKFVETGGQLEVHTDRIVVCFDKRAHNPILRETTLDTDTDYWEPQHGVHGRTP